MKKKLVSTGVVAAASTIIVACGGLIKDIEREESQIQIPDDLIGSSKPASVAPLKAAATTDKASAGKSRHGSKRGQGVGGGTKDGSGDKLGAGGRKHGSQKGAGQGGGQKNGSGTKMGAGGHKHGSQQGKGQGGGKKDGSGAKHAGGNP